MSKFKNVDQAIEAYEKLEAEYKALLAEKSNLETSNKGLQAEVDQVKGLLESKAAIISTRDADLASAVNTIGELQQQIYDKDQLLKEASEDLRDLQEVIDDLRKLKAGPGAKPEFTLDGKTYQVLVKSFNYKGKNHSAQELVENKDLQKELVEIGAGFISEAPEEQPLDLK